MAKYISPDSLPSPTGPLPSPITLLRNALNSFRPRKYSFDLALLTAMLSVQAYENVDWGCADGGWGPDAFWKGQKTLRSHGAEAFTARFEDVVVVAFRGTKGLRDVLTDLRALNPRPWNIPMNGVGLTPRSIRRLPGRVHRGFMAQMDAIGPQVLAELRDHLRSTNKLRIILTGHSLGAILSLLAVMWLDTKGIKVSCCYAHESPRGATTKLCKYFARIFSDPETGIGAFNCAIAGELGVLDRVVLLPRPICAFPFRYGHLGQRRVCTWDSRVLGQEAWRTLRDHDENALPSWRFLTRFIRGLSHHPSANVVKYHHRAWLKNP